MTGEEIISITDKSLKSVSDIKNNIKLIDIELKRSTHDEDMIAKLKDKKNKLQLRLWKTIEAIGTLKEEDQRIICYRYFDNITYKSIALRVGLSSKTIPRRIKKSLLEIGRVIFGFEDELWKTLNTIYE